MFRLVLQLFFLVAVLINAEPHPHSGKVTPFVAGDPGVRLSSDALRTLASGKPYKTQIQSGSTGRGLVVQDVHAPSSVVWDRILDFNHYNKMVPKTVESKTYRKEVGKNGQQRIWVRMKVGFPVLKLQFFVNHLYEPSKNSLIWTLDYSTKSDLDDSCGFWYVIPHPDDPSHWSRVYYSVEVAMFSWVPQFVVDFMSKQALVDATAWVKKFSELEAAKVVSIIPSQTTTPQPKLSWGRRRKSGEVMTPQQPVALVEGTTPPTPPPRPIGLARYALVSAVLGLSFLNVHLYFSQ